MSDSIKTQLTGLIASLGTCYAQECSDTGQLHETAANTVALAVGSCLGAENSIVTNGLLDQFESIGDGNLDHEEFMGLVKAGLDNGSVLYAAAGDPDYFSPEKIDAGGFHFCFLFLRPQTGKNLLVSFRTSMS